MAAKKQRGTYSAPCPGCGGRWDEMRNWCTICRLPGEVVVLGKKAIRRWRRTYRRERPGGSMGRMKYRHGRQNGPRICRMGFSNRNSLSTGSGFRKLNGR